MGPHGGTFHSPERAVCRKSHLRRAVMCRILPVESELLERIRSESKSVSGNSVLKPWRGMPGKTQFSFSVSYIEAER